MTTESATVDEADRAGGIGGKVRKLGFAMGACTTFAKLYLLPVIQNEVPGTVRLTPAW